LENVVVVSNSFKDSGITIKDDAGWKPDVNYHDKRRECTAIYLKIAEKLGRMKNHFTPTEHVR